MQGLPVLHKTFAGPFEAVPAAQEDQAADVFVEGEDSPHGNETPSEGDAKHVAFDRCLFGYFSEFFFVLTDNKRVVDISSIMSAFHLSVKQVLLQDFYQISGHRISFAYAFLHLYKLYIGPAAVVAEKDFGVYVSQYIVFSIFFRFIFTFDMLFPDSEIF